MIPIPKIPPLILASSSPARADILKQAGFDFIVDPANIDEESFIVTPITQLVLTLAEEKAKAVQPRHQNALILAADTIIVHNEHGLDIVIGKPIDDVHAKAILKKLAGTTHRVLTGVCLLDTVSGNYVSGFESTVVTFKPLSDKQIALYVATGESLGKSGAYALQGMARDLFVEKLEGDENNVRGLPLNLLSKLLNKIGC